MNQVVSHTIVRLRRENMPPLFYWPKKMNQNATVIESTNENNEYAKSVDEN